jgi:hypothetical protein
MNIGSSQTPNARVFRPTDGGLVSSPSLYFRPLRNSRQPTANGVVAAQAVDTLAGPQRDSAPPSVRLGAARTVAELGIHRDDAETIMRKLGEIEALQRRNDAEER